MKFTKMTWQKDLKLLKKQLPAKNNKPATQQAGTSTIEAPKEASFKDYCNSNYIKPLIQNTVATQLNIPTKKTVISNSLLSREPAIEFFAEDESKLEFYQFGQKNLPRDLRNGKFPINVSIDLHNYTKNHALDLLERFIKNHFGKCIKIIHGYGLNSNNNKPILIGLVRKYLEYCPEVIAYTYGSPTQGGNGVTICKLKA